MIFERNQLIEVASQPLISLTLPINRVLCIGTFSPAAASIAPKLFALIAAFIHKGSEFGIGDRGARDCEWFNLYLVRVHLVVKNEMMIRHAAAKKASPGYQRIT